MKKIILSILVSLMIGLTPASAASKPSHIDIDVCLAILGRSDDYILSLYSDFEAERLPADCESSYDGLNYLSTITLDECKMFPVYDGGIFKYERVPRNLTISLGCSHLYPNYFNVPVLRVAVKESSLRLVDNHSQDVELIRFKTNAYRQDITVNNFAFKFNGSEKILNAVTSLKLIEVNSGRIIDTNDFVGSTGFVKFSGINELQVASTNNTYKVVADFSSDVYVGEYFNLDLSFISVNSPDLNIVKLLSQRSGPVFFMD